MESGLAGRGAADGVWCAGANRIDTTRLAGVAEPGPRGAQPRDRQGRAAGSSSIREKAFTAVNRSGTKLVAKRRHRQSPFNRPTR